MLHRHLPRPGRYPNLSCQCQGPTCITKNLQPYPMNEPCLLALPSFAVTSLCWSCQTMRGPHPSLLGPQPLNKPVPIFRQRYHLLLAFFVLPGCPDHTSKSAKSYPLNQPRPMMRWRCHCTPCPPDSRASCCSFLMFSIMFRTCAPCSPLLHTGSTGHTWHLSSTASPIGKGLSSHKACQKSADSSASQVIEIRPAKRPGCLQYSVGK